MYRCRLQVPHEIRERLIQREQIIQGVALLPILQGTAARRRQVGVVHGRHQRDTRRTARVDEAHVVAEGLEGIHRDAVLVREHLVVRRLGRALQRAMADQEEVILARMRGVSLDNHAGQGIAIPIDCRAVQREEACMVPLGYHCQRDLGLVGRL